MKRILIFSTAYYPFVGGAEVAIKEITDRLADDYEFEMLTALTDKKLPRLEKVGNVLVHRLGWGCPKLDKLYLAAFGQIKGLKLHRQKNYQVVWAIMASFGGLAASKFQRRTGLKYLLTLQEGDPLELILKKVRLFRPAFNKIFSRADALQAISRYLYDWGVRMGFKGALAEVIPNGVDVGRFTVDFDLREIQAVRNSFGFLPDAKIIVTASRLEVKNGLEDVIRALTQLPQNYCFYVCGAGELETKLKILTKASGLERRVNFAGFKSHEDLPKILKASDIFIRPSLTEGLGNSFLEAMAVGLPTIGTLVGGISDFLQDGATGLVCEPKNPESIARAIIRAGEMSADVKKSLHQNAMKIINERYNWEYISGRMDKMFKGLIG